jgi:TatD DNase family protein
MGVIRAICISAVKGTEKKDVGQAELIVQQGLKGDAHAEGGIRQVSLLSLEKIETFRNKGAEVEYGAFGENLVVEGIDLASLPVGTRFRCTDALLELTQIGKECHSRCAIYQRMGDCIMPREGVFASVLQGGFIKIGDDIQITERSY